MTTLTVAISDELAERLTTAAANMGQPVDELVRNTMQRTVEGAAGASALGDHSDAEILAAADLQMPLEQDARLSNLLAAQQQEPLASEERHELANLMEYYKAGLLYRARALAEAVRRGLRSAAEA